MSADFRHGWDRFWLTIHEPWMAILGFVVAMLVCDVLGTVVDRLLHWVLQ